MPTQRNYNDIKESILKELHQGKDIDQLSKDYSVPKPLIKEWVDNKKQDEDLNIFMNNLSKSSLNKIPQDKKDKKYLGVKCIKKVLFYLSLITVILIASILACSFKHEICNATENQKKDSIYLKLDTILELNKDIETAIISNEKKKLQLLGQTARLMQKTASVDKIIKVRKEYHKQINFISNSNLQKDSI